MDKIKIIFGVLCFAALSVLFKSVSYGQAITICTSADNYCVGSVLHYCENAAFVTKTCANGCSNGACIILSNCKCKNTSGSSTSCPARSDRCSLGSSVNCGVDNNDSGKWEWFCGGEGCNQVTCHKNIMGACGSADDQHVDAEPSGAALCSAGVASGLAYNSSTYGWSWTCTGDGGSATCAAASSCAYNGGSCEGASLGVCPAGYYTVDTSTQFECQAACCKQVTCASLYGSNAQCSSNCRDTNKLTSKGTGGECLSGQVCCNAPKTFGCYTDASCEPCYYCDKTLEPWDCILKTPTSHPSEAYNGSDGVCKTYSGGTCSVTQKCNSSGGSSSISSSSTTYSWTCYGTSGGVCGTDGNDTSCTAKRLYPIDGVCNMSLTTANLTSKPVTTDLCTSGEATWVDSLGTDGKFDWTCSDTNNCGGATANCSAVYDLDPTLSSVVLKNESGTVMSPDGSDRNHICELGFGSSKVTQWVITGADVNGVSDIDNMVLKFTSTSGNVITTAAITAVNGVATFAVDTSSMSAGTYGVSVQINDVDTPPGNSGWIDTGRSFKVWDCLVGVSGTIYDGSAGTISCSGKSGYTSTIPSESVFTLGYFIGTGSPRMMAVNSPNFADGGNKLYWNSPSSYQTVFDDFPGADPTQMKVNNDTCVSGITLDPKLADAYADVPSLKVEYSSVMDQDSWFSVDDGSVFSAGKVTNYVPVTCSQNCMTTVGGIVWQKSSSSGLSSYDTTGSKNTGKSVFIGNYTYDSLYSKYFSTLGIGTTVSTSKKWSEVSSLTGIIFVNGNLEIDENITGSDFKMIVVKGSLIIDDTVNQVKAVLLANSIKATGESNSQLVITGSLYSTNAVTLGRSFIDKASNNETPSVKVVYDPGIIFNMPKELARSVTQWKIN